MRMRVAQVQAPQMAGTQRALMGALVLCLMHSNQAAAQQQGAGGGSSFGRGLLQAPKRGLCSDTRESRA